MQKHSEKLEFEDASRYKKRLESLISIEDEASINVHPLDLDIWHGTFESSTGIAKISVRDGKVRYLEYLPATFNFIKLNLKSSLFLDMKKWMEELQIKELQI